MAYLLLFPDFIRVRTSLILALFDTEGKGWCGGPRRIRHCWRLLWPAENGRLSDRLGWLDQCLIKKLVQLLVLTALILF
jgi:hypothetical protein